MTKFLEKFQARINDELTKFEDSRTENSGDQAATSKLGKANDRLSRFIEKSQKNQSEK